MTAKTSPMPTPATEADTDGCADERTTRVERPTGWPGRRPAKLVPVTVSGVQFWPSRLASTGPATSRTPEIETSAVFAATSRWTTWPASGVLTVIVAGPTAEAGRATATAVSEVARHARAARTTLRTLRCIADSQSAEDCRCRTRETPIHQGHYAVFLPEWPWSLPGRKDPSRADRLGRDMEARSERLFAAHHGFDPAALTRVARRTGVQLVATAVERLNAEFADTDDLRLLRWGATLSHERGAGWRMRDSRVDATVPGVGSGVPSAAGDLVFGVARGEVVSVRARVRITRRGVDVVGVDGAALAAVRVDEVEVASTGPAPGRAGTMFTVVRLVWGPAARGKLVERLQRRVERLGCTAVAPTWTAARAMGAADAVPEVRESDAGPRSSIASVVRCALAGSALRLVGHDPLTRVGDDPEGVHQMRVATRRLRSDMNTFRSLLDPAVVDPLRDELAWLAGLLGTVRDADVLGERLAIEVTALAGVDREAGERLLARLVEDRAAARERLLEAMTSARYARLLDHVVHVAQVPPLVGRAKKKAAKVGGVLVPDRALRSAIKRLGPEPGNRALHKVRIRAKRCRYAAEALAPVFGPEAERYAAVMERCQDVVGAHNDAVIAQAWLRRVAALGSRQEAFVAGYLAGRERSLAAAQRALWPSLRDEMVAKDLRRWLR